MFFAIPNTAFVWLLWDFFTFWVFSVSGSSCSWREGILLSCVQQHSDFLLNLLLCVGREENAVVVF